MPDEIVIEDGPYADILDHVRANSDREVGGFLLGRFEEEAARLVVSRSHRAVGASENYAHLTFTHDAWADLYAHVGDLAVVGWYHSHPGFGIFLSGHDLFIHRNFFPAKHQVAFVVDPKADSEGLFAWDGDEIVRIDEAQ